MAYIKWVSLVLLTLQGCVLPLLVRHSRIRSTPKESYLPSSLVFLNEICKLIACLCIITIQNGKKCMHEIYDAIVLQPGDTLKVCIPSIIYIIQNNLYYVALSNLDPSTYCITYQLKIITTAIFFVLILRQPLSSIQWFSLFVLAAGVAIVQIQTTIHTSAHPSGDPHETHHQNQMLGLIAVLIMSLSSGFAGVYFEKVLKGSTLSIWMQNVRLSLLGIPMSALLMLVNDWKVLREKGIFYGYDEVVISIIILSSLGGLLIAFVIKFADNILKAYSQSFAIILACLGSGLWFEFVPTESFFVGSFLVCVSIYMYSRYPYKPLDSAATPTNNGSGFLRSPSLSGGYFVKLARMSDALNANTNTTPIIEEETLLDDNHNTIDKHEDLV